MTIEEGFSYEIPEDPAFVPPVDTSPPSSEQPLEFDPRVRDDLDGLLYLGKIMHGFSWGGHRFRIKTLTTDERLQAALLAKPWIGTVEEARSWLIATAGLAVISVDDKHIAPLGLSDDTEVANAKFAWAKQQFPWTIDAIWAKIEVLEARVQAAIEKL